MVYSSDFLAEALMEMRESCACGDDGMECGPCAYLRESAAMLEQISEPIADSPEGSTKG